jgi:hypothetical protein
LPSSAITSTSGFTTRLDEELWAMRQETSRFPELNAFNPTL